MKGGREAGRGGGEGVFMAQDIHPVGLGIQDEGGREGGREGRRGRKDIPCA